MSCRHAELLLLMAGSRFSWGKLLAMLDGSAPNLPTPLRMAMLSLDRRLS